MCKELFYKLNSNKDTKLHNINMYVTANYGYRKEITAIDNPTQKVTVYLIGNNKDGYRVTEAQTGMAIPLSKFCYTTKDTLAEIQTRFNAIIAVLATDCYKNQIAITNELIKAYNSKEA